MEETKYLLGFSLIPGFNFNKLEKLLEVFDPASAWKANLPELTSAGFSEPEAQKIIIERSKIDINKELEKITEQKIEIVTINDSAYPKKLKEIFNPPIILYYRGNIACLNKICLSVVGARKHTQYGQEVATKIIPPLVEAGMTIVSGLALGIDALAHQTAVDSNGLTAGVLGSDLDFKNIGPRTNFNLALEIIEKNGCLISEFPLGVHADKTTFPQRNRIIAGLSDATLVIEAGESSGTLITAYYALEQNRDVFAVPGNVFSEYSQGTNNLIKKGAKLISQAEDILSELNFQTVIKFKEAKAPEITDETEKIIYETLTRQPLHLDKLAEISNIRFDLLNAKLMMLELNGLVKNIGGGNYIKI
jgi:DNA processing protein